jgi:hypothetical protein
MVDTSTLAGIMRASQPAPARRVNTSTLAGVQAASRPAPPRPAPPPPPPPAPRRTQMRQTEPPPVSRRTQVRQTEPPAPRTVEEAMRGTDPRSGYSRADQSLAERRGGEMLLAPLSTLTDEAKRTGALERGTPLSYGLTAGAFLGDLFNPSIDIPASAVIQGVGTGIKAANTYRAMSPENQALYRAMLKGLYHGDRSTGANVAQPFDLQARGIKDWAGNWFGGDFFTTGRKLAEEYTQSNAGRAAFDEVGNLLPGFTKEGFPTVRGAAYRISEPIQEVANRRILDLTGRTLDEADPDLYRRLSDMFAGEIADSGIDLAKMDLSKAAQLHSGRYSEAVRPVIEEFGYDTIRHLSGQLQGDIVNPVYAFLNPTGLRANPALPSPGRVGDLLDAGVSSVAQSVAGRTGAVSQNVRQGGKNFLDELASVLSNNDLSQAPGFIRKFADYRTRPLPFGEGFQNTIPHGQDPKLNALFSRLGLGRIWKDPEIYGPRTGPFGRRVPPVDDFGPAL